MPLQTLEMDKQTFIFNGISTKNSNNKKYHAALYLRLSREDGNGQLESMSIYSQKKMLMAYAMENGYEVFDTYIDDGYTGTNFERPNFKRMIKDIKLGKINMVITKDLSRLGRNYILTDQYMDYFFPDYGVRYIAINDMYDSIQEDNEIAPFKAILNETYPKDTSKKVRSQRKFAAHEGKFMGSIPPYGYKRDENNRHKLAVDNYSSKVIRRIFELYQNNESARNIATILNKDDILPPKEYYYRTMNKKNPSTKEIKLWGAETITSILRNEVYTGKMVQSKRRVKSFKTKKIEKLPPEMWIVVENTHEAIIDEDTFQAVAQLMEKNKNSKPRKIGEGGLSLFSGILRCKDCKSKMNLTSRQRKDSIDYEYRCSGYSHKSKDYCSPHGIKLDVLEAIVLADIKQNAKLAKEDEEEFIKKLQQVSMREKIDEQEVMKSTQKYLLERLSEVDLMIRKSFEKNCSGVLPDDLFETLVNDYKKEKLGFEQELTSLKEKMLLSESQTKNIGKEIDKLKRYTEITELNRSIVTNLIQTIYISEAKVVDGEKIYDIEIRYKFHKVLMEEIKKDTASENTVSNKTEQCC